MVILCGCCVGAIRLNLATTELVSLSLEVSVGDPMCCVVLWREGVGWGAEGREGWGRGEARVDRGKGKRQERTARK